MKQRVVVLGKGTLAIRIADWFVRHPGYDLVEVVPVMPEPTWTESLRSFAEQQQVPFPASGHYRDLQVLRNPAARIDLAFSVFYDKIIKPWFIERCDRILNLHNGPLPRYRGVSPINWALKNNERSHGVTIHDITPGIDDGPIVAQLQYSIYPEFDEVQSVYHRAIEYGWLLFQQTMPLLAQISPEPQAHAQATYYSARDAHLLGERSNWTRPVSRGLVEAER